MLQRAGVARLSVGVQSFDDGLLRAMGRYEKYGSAASIREHLAGVTDAFPTLNIDMIFNLPGQTRAMLDRDLDIIVERARRAAGLVLSADGRVFDAPRHARAHGWLRREPRARVLSRDPAAPRPRLSCGICLVLLAWQRGDRRVHRDRRRIHRGGERRVRLPPRPPVLELVFAQPLRTTHRRAPLTGDHGAGR